ncbi:MAG: hypothetical protein JSS36_00130 [Proteobacteria bacterium]|nr:hypothetical protein [Pseudomonadota bacterium]
MSIFQLSLTRQWAILVKSLRDGGMASISGRSGLGNSTTIPGGHLGPICSPLAGAELRFRRLDGAVYEFTA